MTNQLQYLHEELAKALSPCLGLQVDLIATGQRGREGERGGEGREGREGERGGEGREGGRG